MKFLEDVSKHDLTLYNYLVKGYENFTLANYVDYLNSDELALCHVDKNGVRREFTYNDLSKLSKKMANYLRKKGVRKGDVVALVLRSNFEFYIASLAIEKLGAVTLTLQYTNKEEQYKSVFGRTKPKCVIADDYEIVQSKTTSSFVLNEIDKSGYNMVKLCTYPNSTYSNSWGRLDDYLNESDNFKNEDVSIYDLGYLFSTSGTTGEPKLVMHNYGFALSHFYTGLWYGVEKGKKHYTIADSGWGMGTWNMCGVLIHQGTMYINDFNRFNPSYILECMKEEDVNSLCAPRSILVPMLEYLDNNDVEVPNLETISSAGETVDVDVKRRCFNQFGVIPKEGYGMTEVVLPIYEDEGKKVVSPLYDGVSIETVNGLESGEIIVNGGRLGLLMGYLDNVIDKTRKFIVYRRPPMDNNLFVWHTGDAGRIDENGSIACDGRLGNTVKVNDCLVNKSMVELVIKGNPCVHDCMVESKKDPISGNVLYAYVELKGRLSVTEEEIKQYVKSKLPDYCRPKYVVFKELDRTCNGKLKRTDIPPAPDKHLVIRARKCV